MAPRCLLDTNVIVRHLVQDHRSHAEASARLFESAGAGGTKLILLTPVLAESVFVLESFYEHTRADIARALRLLIASPGIEAEHATVCDDALRRYSASTLHFVDCVLAATSAAGSVPIATFDRELLGSEGACGWVWG